MAESSIPRSVDRSLRRLERERLLARRAELSPAWRAQASQAIARSLAPCIAALSPAATIAVYWPIRGEPELPTADRAGFWGGRELALPRVLAPGEPLQFGRWRADVELRFDRWGIGTPEPFEPVLPDLLVIPCVGFDRQGFRLGYGAGFYDRTLAIRPVPTIGVAWDWSELEGLAWEPHDRPLDRIITERRVLTPAPPR
jgi:5-formyltetrahydrofolate cyclo-ligase